MKTRMVPSNQGSDPPTPGRFKAFLQKYQAVESDLIASPGRKIKQKKPHQKYNQDMHTYIFYIYIFRFKSIPGRKALIYTDWSAEEACAAPPVKKKNKKQTKHRLHWRKSTHTENVSPRGNRETPRQTPGCTSQHAAGVQKGGHEGGTPGRKVPNMLEILDITLA